MHEASPRDDRTIPRLPAGALLTAPREERARTLPGLLRQQPGAVILEGVPTDTNTALLTLASSLGPVTAKGTLIPGHPLEDGCVYRVEPVNSGRGVRDDDGLLIFSTTTQVFEGHTDGYHNPVPPTYVLLLCVRPDQGTYGRTLVTDAFDVLRLLTAECRRLLSDEAYPASFGRTAILAGPLKAPVLRFNFKELQRFRAAGHSIDGPHWDAVEALHCLASRPDLAWRHILKPGDLLILDNARAVHAREPLSPGSTRLLKRVWVAPVTEGVSA